MRLVFVNGILLPQDAEQTRTTTFCDDNGRTYDTIHLDRARGVRPEGGDSEVARVDVIEFDLDQMTRSVWNAGDFRTWVRGSIYAYELK